MLDNGDVRLYYSSDIFHGVDLRKGDFMVKVIDNTSDTDGGLI